MGCGSSTDADPPPSRRNKEPTQQQLYGNGGHHPQQPNKPARTPTPEAKTPPPPDPQPAQTEPKPQAAQTEPKPQNDELRQQTDLKEEKPVEEENPGKAKVATPPPHDQDENERAAVVKPPQADQPESWQEHKPSWYRRREPELGDDDGGDHEDENITVQDAMVRMGRRTVVLDTRVEPWAAAKQTPPDVAPGELFIDSSFPKDVAMAGEKEEVEWKRPSEVYDDPQLFTDGTTRFDIKQGGAGTCWFLSILAALGDKPEVIKQVIPDEIGSLSGDGYDGVFHCRFFRNGEWHDVYCDDYLPFKYDKPWGARAADEKEMWVSLMEKAFAKFHGGYTQIYGGWAGSSFIALTGGVAERIEMDEISEKQLFKRVKNALKSGSVIACSVPAEKDGDGGLVGGHAYTLTGAIKIGFNDAKVSLLRVRNPWGVGQGEWTGKWSDNSSAWDSVPKEAKEKLRVRGKEDGEFWMELGDFFDHFRDTHVCNFTPDFDKDGTTDGLDQVVEIFGDWKGPTAGGREKKMDCQKFIFKVSEEDLDDDGSTPVVIQLMQKLESRHDQDFVYMRADLYSIAAEKKADGEKHWACEELTNYVNYFGGATYHYRYKLNPGYYMLVPHTMEAGKENGFIVRIFSKTLFSAAEEKSPPDLFLLKLPRNFEHNGSTYDVVHTRHHFLEWKDGVNAGGQVSNDSFNINPQITLDLSSAGENEIPALLGLTQEHREDLIAIGFKLFKLPDGVEAPVDLDWLYENYSSALATTEGKQVFVVGETADGNYILTPGRYLIILFTDNPGVERKLCYTVSLTQNHFKENTVSTLAMLMPSFIKGIDDTNDDRIYDDGGALRHAGLL